MNIEKTITIDNPVAKVYAAWVSSDTVIPPATRMDIDARVGGHYILHATTPEFSARNAGTFSVVEPNQRLVYSWEWDNDGEASTIDVRFTAKGDQTVIDLVHSGFKSEGSVSQHDAGWDHYFAGLAAFLAD
ncbi:MAG: SRPBCC domain-containing protein [Pseudomonadota bacterium]